MSTSITSHPALGRGRLQMVSAAALVGASLLVAGCAAHPAGDTLAALPTPGASAALLADDDIAAPTSVIPEPRRFTPGQASPATTAALCVLPRKVKLVATKTVRTEVFTAYKLKYASPDYDLDALIPLTLGGTLTAQNLWPMPTGIAFSEKTQLDQRLRALVCSDEMPLRTAQKAETSGWYQSWLTYVGS